MTSHSLPLVFFIWLLFLIRPITVFFHEMGHAIIARIFTKKDVKVFIGSYGNTDRSFSFKIGPYIYYFYKNPIKWGRGVCIAEANVMSIDKQILFSFGGPLMSLVFAIITFIINYYSDFKNLFFLLLFYSSLIDFVANLIPFNRKIALEDGRTTTNDGSRILALLKLKKLPAEFPKAVNFLQNKQYAEAVKIFEELVVTCKKQEVYRLAIFALVKNNEIEKAKSISNEFKTNFDFNSDDFVNHGICYTETGEFEEALKFYDESLKLNPKNKFSLNNKAYTFCLQAKYDDAIPLLNEAIALDKNMSHAYSNLALAKVKTGQLEEAFYDAQKSIEITPELADPYKALGIYYVEKREFYKALEQFQKSKSLENPPKDIDKLIEDVTLRIKTNENVSL